MLPLSLLKTAQNHPMLVELKNGETYNGHLVSCDNWMNINLREVICTSRDGDKFWRMPECYIRGSTIKYLRIPDEIIDMVKEEVVAKGRGRGGLQQQKQQKGRGMGGAGRGGSPLSSGRTWGGKTTTRGIPPSWGWPSSLVPSQRCLGASRPSWAPLLVLGHEPRPRQRSPETWDSALLSLRLLAVLRAHQVTSPSLSFPS
ncbi:U6 snRNA-associated Sm-like protein LSm4 isoform X1 [Symphalangus syndactylus]|uniref:U6 snRNA-associated Sm-like protein LSm4 isoform X1 n=1 Tax=Symphalangus syndactylus TaxID=9590 RepID=UPI003005156B